MEVVADMEQRVARLEVGVSEIKGILGRLEPMIARMDERLSHMTTRAEFEAARGAILVALESKPSRGSMWVMGLTIFGLAVAALAAGAAYLPLVVKAAHLT